MPLRTPLAAAAAAVAALVGAPAALAAGSSTFTDVQGDAPGAPDVRTVDVANDDAGKLTIRVTVDSFVVPSDSQIGVFLDTDRNNATGDARLGGVDFALFADANDNTFDVDRWDGSQWASIDTHTAGASSTPTGVTFRVDRSELGGTSVFDFLVAGQSGDSIDFAPDSGRWSYTLSLAPPKRRAPSIARIGIRGTSILPRAGTTFTFGVAFVQLDDGRTGTPTTTCTATLAGRAFVGAGPGRCTWKLPVSARGKQLVVTVTVTYAGASATQKVPLTVGR